MTGPRLDTFSTQQDALNFAFLYGYPLLEFGKLVAGLPNATVNTLYHDRLLSTSEDRKVIRPNVDTLYSIALLDFSSHDLEITIPEIEDRYWCFSFYDLYGNNIGNISNLQGCKPGKYAVRFADQGFAFFAQPDDFYQGHVNMPGAYGIALIRIATTPELRDQRVANEHQDRVKLSTIPIQRPFTTPALDLSIFSTHGFFVFDTVTTEQAVLRLTAKLATHNQSPVLEDRRRIAQLLSKARIEPSRLETCSASSLSEASRYAKGQVVESMKAPRGMQHHGQGWSSPFPDFVGNYGSSYAGRFVIARGGYLALTRDQSVYPSRAEPLFLEPKKALILRFSRRPTLVKHGFWSLTAYNDDQYLVPNRLRRFCLGDRNILRFPDGTPLSRKAKDGPFEILLQPADLLPPEEWMDNWLPVPEGGGKFSITLRWYGPTEELLSNDYVYPELKTIDAILQANGSML